MKLNVNGMILEGTPSEIAAVISGMGGTTTKTTTKKSSKIDYNAQGIEQTSGGVANTPSIPSKDIKTNYKVFEDCKVAGKKVYRIGEKIWNAKVNRAAKKVAKLYLSDLVDEGLVKTAEFSFTDDRGREVTYTGYYCTTKKAVEKALSALPKVITYGEQLAGVPSIRPAAEVGEC